MDTSLTRKVKCKSVSDVWIFKSVWVYKYCKLLWGPGLERSKVPSNMYYATQIIPSLVKSSSSPSIIFMTFPPDQHHQCYPCFHNKRPLWLLLGRTKGVRPVLSWSSDPQGEETWQEQILLFFIFFKIYMLVDRGVIYQEVGLKLWFW